MPVKVKHGIRINRSVQDVFAFISDPDNMPKWQSTLHNVKGKQKTKGDGKLQHQARVRDERNVLGKEIDSEYEVVNFQQDKTLELMLVNGPVSFRMRWDLEAVDGGTFLTADGGGDLGNLGMSDQAANNACQHLLEGDLRTLRTLLETP